MFVDDSSDRLITFELVVGLPDLREVRIQVVPHDFRPAQTHPPQLSICLDKQLNERIRFVHNI